MHLLTMIPVARPFGLQAVGEVVGTIVLTVALLLAAAVLVAGLLAGRRDSGEASALSRWAVRAGERLARPLWEPLPIAVVLAGLALALFGWRSLTADGVLGGAGSYAVVAGLTVTLLGGVLAGALAHPPASLVEHESEAIARPTPAHRLVATRARLGAGPVSAPVIVVASLVALLAMPVAAAWRLVGGSAADDAVAHRVVVVAVLVIALAAWGLLAEGRSAAARAGTLRARRIDLGEVATACAALLALSVTLDDGGLPAVAVAVAGVAVLLLARVRGGAGVALAAAGGYGVVRLTAAALTGAFAAEVAPLAWQGLVAATAVEVVAGVVAATSRQVRGMSGPAADR